MRRMFYYITLKNISPVHIGTGDGEYTDMDVLKDGDGNVFIPGTAFAGSILHYLSEEERRIVIPERELKNEKQEKTIIKLQSPIYFSDAELDRNAEENKVVNIESRDGIKLNENKTTEKMGKYDYQIIPEGHIFNWRIEVCDREEHTEETKSIQLENIVEKAIVGLDDNNIRIGFKTTRGLGKFKILEVRRAIFNRKNFINYVSFDPFNKEGYSVVENKDLNHCDKKSVTIDIYLEQNGGLSIRTYNTKKGAADFEHIHSNGKPIIPGTSWNGLLRSCLKTYVNELHFSKTEIDIDEIFGYVDNTKKKKSLVYVDESIIEGGEDITMTRNRINPFTASTVTGALFKETTHYNGKSVLRISISEKIVEDKDVYNRLLGLIKIFVNDLNNGFIALGGQTSIGRGLFKVNKVEVNEVEDTSFIVKTLKVDGGKL